jgi:elongation factor Ts
MAEITAAQVKQLRDKTGAGMMECKAALQEAGGSEEKAIELLRKKGLASAAKRAGRATANGVVGSYIHMGGKVGVLVEVNCETDFVARFAGSGKPANVVEKIVEGKLGSFYSQVALLDQPSVRDPDVTVSQMVAQASAKTGENITVGRFARFKVGEGATE